jgi:SSS family solute:Na+ symporter
MNWFVTIGGIAYNIVIILVCTAVIMAKRKAREGYKEDFLFAGRSLGWFTCAAGMALTALGGGHINGLTAQSWSTGVATMFYCFAHGFFFIIVMRYVGIWYRRMGCSTVNELFGKMFNPAFVPLLAGLGIGYSWMVLCVETQGMAQVISSMTGLSNLNGAIIGAIVGMLYVFLAGLEEVGLVNAVNAILMYVFGIIVLIFIGYNTFIGGWEPINDTLLANNPELVYALGNPDILRTYVIGTFFATMLGMNFVQGNIQAVAGVENIQVLRKACNWAIPMNALFGVIILSMGLASKYLNDTGLLHSPHGAAGVVELVLNYMPNWLQICVIGMFLAAMLSTFAMLSLAIAIMLNRDTLSSFAWFKNMSPKRETMISRVWILLAGSTAAFAAVAIQAQTNTALTWGWAWFVPMFFIFVIGMKWKRSRKGAMATIIICWVLNVVLTFTPLAAVFHLEGNNYSIFMIILSVCLGLLFTALDKNAAISYRKLYEIQRAAFDAATAKKSPLNEERKV